MIDIGFDSNFEKILGKNSESEKSSRVYVSAVERKMIIPHVMNKIVHPKSLHPITNEKSVHRKSVHLKLLNPITKKKRLMSKFS